MYKSKTVWVLIQTVLLLIKYLAIPRSRQLDSYRIPIGVSLKELKNPLSLNFLQPRNTIPGF